MRKVEEVFPVSSGDRHRVKELEWMEVTDLTSPTDLTSKEPKKKANKSKEQPDDSLRFRTIDVPGEEDGEVLEIPVPSSSTALTKVPEKEKVSFDDIGVKPTAEIGSIVSQRLAAMKILQNDPFNVVALKQLHEAQEMVCFVYFIVSCSQ